MRKTQLIPPSLVFDFISDFLFSLFCLIKPSSISFKSIKKKNLSENYMARIEIKNIRFQITHKFFLIHTVYWLPRV
jgi:hypothetical protein